MPNPRKKLRPEAIEQRSYVQFDPENVKKTVEIAVRQRPTIEEIEKVEKIGTGIKKIKPFRKIPPLKKSTSKNAFLEERKLKAKGHILIITEKPQAASKIAAALSNGRDRKLNNQGVPFYELERGGKNIIVACAVGHLFTISQIKKEQGYPVFDIGWFPNFQIKKKDFTRKYYLTIQKLVKNASEVIVATDFDTEGEVIGYNIIRFIAGQKDAKRMKFSSLTAQELQDSYEHVHPTIEWGQAIAGETRHFLDWLYGINLSRALMNAIKSTGKFKIMSIGRVQGPALNLIVEREKEILAFKSTPYWQVFLTISDGNPQKLKIFGNSKTDSFEVNKTELKYIKDIVKKSELDKFNSLIGRKANAITTKTKQIIIPPSPFDLTSLQTEAYKFHGITPSQTLAAAQKLYLQGLISYPRTSSQKIPDAMMPKKILKELGKHFPETENAVRERPIEGKKSDPAHPAIIPTGTYERLESQEEKIYNLIVKRFISCFCDDAELENKRVEMEIDGLRFNEKGMEIIKEGWMRVYPAKMEEKEIKDFNGEVLIEKLRTEEKMTQPPKRYSPASIITELERRNLGTKATRSSIIDTLYDRDYIKDKSIKATELGIKLIDSLKKHSPIIIDENLTRNIEKEMDQMRVSKKDLDKKEKHVLDEAKQALIKISNDFKKSEQVIGKELVEANQSHWNQQKEDNKLDFDCPACKKGKLTIKFSPRFRNYFIACTNYPECRQIYSLPSKSLIKKMENDKKCEECSWPMLLCLRQGKKPWVLCFNPECPKRKNTNNSNGDKGDNGDEE